MNQMSIFDIKHETQELIQEQKGDLGDLKQKAKQLLETRDYEKLSKFIYDSGVDYYKKIAEYIDTLLPEECYYDALLRRINRYKHKIGDQVICTKFPKHFKAKIIERRAFCWYVIKSQEDNINYWTEEYLLKKVEVKS